MAEESSGQNDVGGETVPSPPQPPPVEQVIQREEREKRNVTHAIDFKDDEDEDLPFPGFVPVAFRRLKQTTPVRYWCLKAVTWPYPFYITKE